MDALQVPILCYHRVHKDDDPTIPEVVPGEYCGHVTESVFKMQMKWLADSGFQTITHMDIMRWLYEDIDFQEKKLIAIDFDDARLNVFEVAFPIMREYGFIGTVFVVSELASGNLPEMMKFPAMNWEHLSTLLTKGWWIGAHTANHSRLVDLYNTDRGEEKVEIELSKDYNKIKKHLGIETLNFAYPQGNWNEQVEVIVRKYYRTARLWHNDFSPLFNTHKTNPYRLNSLNVSMLVTEDNFKTVLFKI